MRATSPTCPFTWFSWFRFTASVGSTPGATLLMRVPPGACPLPSVTWL